MDIDDQAVEELIQRVAPTLISDSDRYTELWDLDELFWKNYPRPWNIDRAFQAFLVAIDSYAQWANLLVVGLQLWLTQTATLCTEAPSLDGAKVLSVNEAHPPGISISKKARPSVPTYELYRRPVEQNLIRPPWGEIEAQYDCFRTRQAMAADEPYDRVVVFWHNTKR
jgi:hypothetical protein